MQESLSISKQRKRKVVSTILNLYLFDELETPKFEVTENILKKKVTSVIGLNFLKGGYSDLKNEKIFDFFSNISQRFPEDIKEDIYFLMCFNAHFHFNKNLKLLATLNPQSAEEGKIDLGIEDTRIHSEIYFHFVKNPGLIDIMNDFLYFLADFHSFLEVDSQNHITKKSYQSAIRMKLKQIDKYERVQHDMIQDHVF